MSNSDCEEIIISQLNRPLVGRRRRRRHAAPPPVDDIIFINSETTPNNNNTHNGEIVDLTSPSNDDVIATVDLTSPSPVANKRFRIEDVSESSTSRRERRNAAFTCPICLEALNKIVTKGHDLCSTTCGHVFCKPCITKSIQSNTKCPTCRKKLTARNIHPLYL